MDPPPQGVLDPQGEGGAGPAGEVRYLHGRRGGAGRTTETAPQPELRPAEKSCLAPRFFRPACQPRSWPWATLAPAREAGTARGPPPPSAARAGGLGASGRRSFGPSPAGGRVAGRRGGGCVPAALGKRPRGTGSGGSGTQGEGRESGTPRIPKETARGAAAGTGPNCWCRSGAETLTSGCPPGGRGGTGRDLDEPIRNKNPSYVRGSRIVNGVTPEGRRGRAAESQSEARSRRPGRGGAQPSLAPQ